MSDSTTQVIDELDNKAKSAIKQTWLKVNEYFGNIFSTLLPGASAKLEPPEGQSYLEGAGRGIRSVGGCEQGSEGGRGGKLPWSGSTFPG